MRVLCENCNEPIPPGNLELARNLAKCSVCGNVFNCADQLAGVATDSPADEHRAEVAMPKGIRVFRRANALRIVKKWFGPKWFFLAFFCLFWDGFMVVWFTIAIAHRQWAMAAFGTIHGAVGLGLLYAVLAGFLNTTTITVMKSLLQIVHGPIKVPGNKRFPADQIKQLYTKRHVSHSNNGTSVSYELRALTFDGRDEKLIGSLDRQEQSLFMEQEIEAFLAIEDRPIRGEVER